jgi:hypothetical protein
MGDNPVPVEQPTTDAEETYLDRALNPTPTVGESKTHYVTTEAPPRGSEEAGPVARRQAQPK